MRIIEEWWSGTIEEDEWFASNTDKPKAMTLLAMGTALEHVHPIALQLLYGVNPPVTKVSTYRLEIFVLFQMEFDPKCFEEEDVGQQWTRLQQQRERSAVYAAVQRITFPFRAIRRDSGQEDSGNTLRLNEWEDIIGRVQGACIEPCPWLEFKKGLDGYPFYLWDAEAKRTVEVSELHVCPKYICISHTWGRWKDRAKPYLEVPKVPWLVPQNGLFRVEELPEILHAAFPGQYIWLDLFCIPQDRSKRALQEISRQAAIFGNASIAIAWLNDVQDWKGLRDTVEWLSMYYLQNRGVDDDEVLPDIITDRGTGLVLAESFDGDELTPGNWFTSLWTLQEVCLRPDMLMCTKEFEVFTVGVDTVVTLDSLAALFNFVIGDVNQSPFEAIINRKRLSPRLESGTNVEYESVHMESPSRRRRVLEQIPIEAKGLHELWTTLLMSGMSKIFEISPASIFYLAQRRQCTSSRAEAIMSVVGSTEWYDGYIRQQNLASQGDSGVVVGLYPADFLNECARKMGATFYVTVASNLNNISGVVDWQDGAWEPLDTSLAVGSILPFTSGPTVLLPVEHRSRESQSHPSISSWTILSDGKVKIPQVGVLSSSLGEHSSDLRAHVRVPGVPESPVGEVNIHEWIRTFRFHSTEVNYAISIYQASRRIQWGLILKCIGSGNILVKVGTFFTDALTIQDVPTQRVDWIVL
jgi:hypothetical protein